MEAYKLLAKICIKQNEFEEILSILNETLDNEDYGDLYYIRAQIFKLLQNYEDYANNLNSALECPTLTYPKNIVKQEYDVITYKLEHQGEE